MTDRVLLGDGLEFSRLAYGMWRIGDDDTAPRHVQAKIVACLEQGITTIDQADIYGGYTAEAVLGACLRAAPALRDRIEIVTKCGIVAPAGRYADRRVKHYDTSEAHIAASIDQSLTDMAIEQIDLLLIHRPDPLMNHYETGGALDGAVRSGKVRAVGVSNFRPHDLSLLQSAMQTRLVTNQIELSLMAHRAFVDGDIAYMQERGMLPMAWSPLAGGGLLTAAPVALGAALDTIAKEQGVDRSAVAVAWLLAHPSRIVPVMGSNDLGRIARFSDATRVEIDRQTWFELYTAALGQEVA
ncbi:aldo/keto reductase [Mesorhizobium sp. CAU 1732]|jgi:predicted oxidoreductase|uniref:aldo/keto reductase n=1 Tax=Mesorhizobium sp. CAU 1732 TaxID=3140358 RepID=UPI0032615681